MSAPERCGDALNRGLHRAMENDPRVHVLGEDILDPYGGAFKITKGLSDRFPERVHTTPISEASIVGIAGGMAVGGLRPVVEIMFGDFITLAFDQIVNGISKYREMYDEQVSVPMVMRTPMGGRRGYGPTHSQSLEKFLVGVPNVTVVAASEVHDLDAMMRDAIDDDTPVMLIENKLMYGRPNRRPQSGRIEHFDVRETSRPYPALTFSANGFANADATIIAYGGMVPVALDAATELLIEEEVFVEVVALSQLSPLDITPARESVARTGRAITAEEGTLTAGIGAELAAQLHEQAWGSLTAPVVRVAAADGIIPSAPALENAMLPGVNDLVGAVIDLVGAPAA